jgi:tryptophan halogenase
VLFKPTARVITTTASLRGTAHEIFESLAERGFDVSFGDGVVTLMSLFPAAGFDQAEIDEYNRLMSAEIETARDFVILHYKQTQRDDTPFWQHVRNMNVPESLARRMAVFANRARLFIEPGELFSKTSWVAVMLGQGLDPRGYDPLADSFPEAEVRSKLQRMRALIRQGVNVLPSHAEFLSCAQQQQ